MPNKRIQPSKQAAINPSDSPRITSRVKLSQMQMWVNELLEMTFSGEKISTRQIAKWYSGDAKHAARVSFIGSGQHMPKDNKKPQIRPTEAEFEGLRRTYFMVIDMTDKLKPLMKAALEFHGDMAKAQTSANGIVSLCVAMKGKRK